MKKRSPRKAGKLALQAHILDGLRDSVILVNERREVVGYNRAARELLHLNIKGLDLALSLPHQRVIEAADDVLSGKPPRTVEVTLSSPIARTFELHASVLPAKVPGKAVWALLVMHDVTESKTAEKIRADFVANISHELRSPLTSLCGFIETLKGVGREDAESRDWFLEIMEAEAKRMTRLVDDLLSLSRVEAMEHIRPDDTLAIKHLLKEVVDTVSARGRRKGIEVELDCAGSLPAVAGDRDELNEVFHNLLDNAIKYGREKTPARVTARVSEDFPGLGGEGVSVAVENTGDGIEPKHIPRLTERFYRVDKGRSREMGGTGLGLAIVKHIVNRHRGHLAITSTPGEKTVFTVFLPSA